MGLGLQRLNFIRALSQREAASYSIDTAADYLVPVVMCPEGSSLAFNCFNLLSKPWLCDGYTVILSSVWGSTEVIHLVNVLSGKASSRINAGNSSFSYSLLALDGNNAVMHEH
uniref:Acylamino-acid-releasing enzyme N-terminal domain-containing protein n=1 Tax=Solanum lycopersicum TaxID=4081 RepID=A0A3Q7I6X6_SOLLC